MTDMGKTKKKVNRKKKKQLQLIAILLMLLLIAAALTWLTLRGRALNRSRMADVTGTLESAEQAVTGGTGFTEDLENTYKAAQHVYSHRGSEGNNEHSFKAYDDAIAAGSIYIEQDLVLSQDGVLFVSHDLSAESMTGVSKLYSSMSAEEIDGLKTKAGGKVLRMSEVFDKYGTSVNYVIELKAYEDSRMIDRFKELVDKYGYQDRIIVQCADIHPLRKLEEIYPDMTKLYICKSQWGFDTSINETYIDIISVKEWLMTEERCKIVHDKGKKFSAWWLDSEESIKRAIDMGVDTYFTNDTPLAISIEKDYGLQKRGE